MTAAKLIRESFWNTLQGLIEEFPEFDSLGTFFVQVDGEPYTAAGGDRIDFFRYSEEFGYEDEEEFNSHLSEGIDLSGIVVESIDLEPGKVIKRLELTYLTPSGSELELNFDLNPEYTQDFYELNLLMNLWAFNLGKPLDELLKKSA